jgi:hypothetical protein
MTLLELLLALTLLVIILTMLYGVLVSTLNAQARIEEAVETSEVGPMLLKMISDDLMTIFVPPSQKEVFVGKEGTCSFGDADRIDFLSTRPSWDDTNEKLIPITEVGYLLKDNPEYPGMQRIFRREDVYTGENTLRGGKLMELYDLVRGLKFRYYDMEKKEWTDGWDNTKRKDMPAAVFIEVDLAFHLQNKPAHMITEQGPYKLSTIVKFPR